MAAIQEFARVSAQLSDTATKMLEFQHDWVDLSDRYPGELMALNLRLEEYKDEINERGELDNAVITILKKGVRALRWNEARLDELSALANSDHCCAPMRLWCVKLMFSLYPENVETILMNVNAELEMYNSKALQETAAAGPSSPSRAGRDRSSPVKIPSDGLSASKHPVCPAELLESLSANDYDRAAAVEQVARGITMPKHLVDQVTQPTQPLVRQPTEPFLKMVKLLAEPDPTTKGSTALGLGNLAAIRGDSVKQTILTVAETLPSILEGLQSNVGHCQRNTALLVCNLAESEVARAELQRLEGLLDILASLLYAGVNPATQLVAARALALMDCTRGQQACLASSQAHFGRSEALNYLKMHEEALADLNKAYTLPNGDNFDILRHRCFTKTRLGDLDGALEDANSAVELCDTEHMPDGLQERGILKRIMEDLEGALADLDQGLDIKRELESKDVWPKEDYYEILKHRGFVKFLLGDEAGARSDAEWARRIVPRKVEGHNYESLRILGVMPVEYLGYKLKCCGSVSPQPVRQRIVHQV